MFVIIFFILVIIFIKLTKSRGGDFSNIPKPFIKMWYKILSKYDIATMNYGYSKYLDNNEKIYQIDYFSLNLYDHMSKNINNKKNVLEIGCGRGGGIYHVAKKYPNINFIGLDFIKSYVDLANKKYNLPNLSFKHGDAENLNFPDKYFDIILNVESAHNYKNMNKFLSGAKKILKDDGIINFTDLYNKKYVDENKYMNNFRKHFKIKNYENITKNVFNAINNNIKSRKTHTEKLMKKYKIPFFEKILFSMWMDEFLSNKNSKIYKQFKNGNVKYICMQLSK